MICGHFNENLVEGFVCDFLIELIGGFCRHIVFQKVVHSNTQYFRILAYQFDFRIGVTMLIAADDLLGGPQHFGKLTLCQMSFLADLLQSFSKSRIPNFETRQAYRSLLFFCIFHLQQLLLLLLCIL